ncbi:MAG TPA: hypothetical protein VGC42_08045, partial [Kofleriaceae bacterium]
AARSCGSDSVQGDRPLRARIADVRRKRCVDAGSWACALDQAGAAIDPAAARADVLAAVSAQAVVDADTARKEPVLARKLDGERAAARLWNAYLADRPMPRPVADLRGAIARDEAALAAAQQRAQTELKRQAAAAERERRQQELAAERERRQQELAAQRAQQREAASGLMCNDGTLSPTCSCGGSHRGCCSWHGGVAGCQ